MHIPTEIQKKKRNIFQTHATKSSSWAPSIHHKAGASQSPYMLKLVTAADRETKSIKQHMGRCTWLINTFSCERSAFSCQDNEWNWRWWKERRVVGDGWDGLRFEKVDHEQMMNQGTISTSSFGQSQFSTQLSHSRLLFFILKLPKIKKIKNVFNHWYN